MNMNVNMNTVLRLKIQKLPEVLEDKIYRMNHQMIFSQVVGEFVERVEYLDGLVMKKWVENIWINLTKSIKAIFMQTGIITY